MRVAIDARLLAYQSAGTSTYIRGLVQGLHAFEPDMSLLAIASRKDPEPRSLIGISRRISWTPCHHRWERWALGVELANLPVDVLHSPDFIPPARLGRRWARVITIHDLAYLRFPDLLTPASRRYYAQVERATAEAERIIAVSETTRADLLSMISPSLDQKITVIPEGVDPVFAPESPTEASTTLLDHVGISTPYFLFVGTVEPRKNLPRTIRAFQTFRASLQHPDVSLVIAGSRGWLAEETDRALAEAGPSVKYLGRVAEDVLITLLRGALALVLVSLYEGFGLPALEAMACGTPVLAANSGALPELVGDAGVLVDPENEVQIASGLKYLWADPIRRGHLAERGLERAKSYRWPVVARQTADVYRQAAACAS